MKKIILLSFLLISFLSNAQSNYQRRLYHTASSAVSSSIIYSNEYNTSTFVVRIIYPGTPFTAYSDVTKFTTSTGNVTSSKTFSVSGYDLKVLDVAKNNQMLYLTASLTNSLGTVPCIIKYNLSTNATVWRKTLSINNEVFRSITYDNAKNIYLLGNYFNAAQSKTDIMIAKMDTNGVLFWTKNIGETTLNQNQNCGNIVFNGNRALYVTESQPNSVVESSVLRMDSAGTIITSKTIKSTSPKFFQNFATILNGKLVSVDRSIISSTEGPILIRMLDTNLTTVASRTLAPTILLQDVYSNNNNLLVSGVVTSGYGYKTIRLDTVLGITGSRHFSKIPVPGTSFGNLTSSFINSSNASFHFFNPYGMDTVYIAKADIFEGVGCKDSVYNVTNAVFNYTIATLNYTTSAITNTATNITIPVANATYTSSSICTALTTGINSIADNDEFISVYPNPANEILNVKLEMINGEEKHIRVINSLGQVLIEQRSLDDNLKFEIGNFQKGIYFISLYNAGGQLIYTKKFIKE